MKKLISLNEKLHEKAEHFIKNSGGEFTNLTQLIRSALIFYIDYSEYIKAKDFEKLEIIIHNKKRP